MLDQLGLGFDTMGLPIPAIPEWYENVSYQLEGQYPKMNIDFVNQRYAINNTAYTFEQLFTYSRTGPATRINSAGLMESVAANAIRWDYNPTTLAFEGYLAEQTATNELLWSNDLTNATWTKAGIDVTKSGLDLFGTTDGASLLTATSALGTVIQMFSKAAANRRFSLYMKRKTGTGNIALSRDAVNYTNVQGSINSSTWTRVGINSSVLNPTVSIRIDTSGDEVYVCCLQDEVGTTNSTYIPTTTAAQTRGMDNLTIEGTNFSSFYVVGDGTLYCKYDLIRLGDGFYETVLSLRSSLVNTYLGIEFADAGSDRTRINLFKSGASNTALVLSALTVGTVNKSAVGYSAAASRIVTNNTASTDVATALPTKLNAIKFSDGVNCHIKEARYYSIKPSNANLALLTV